MMNQHDEAEIGAGDLMQQRSRRILESMTDALADPNPVLSGLGAAASDMMDIGRLLKEAIDRSLELGDRSLRHWSEAAPAVNQLLQVYRQFDRFVQLDRRLRAEE